jgi:HD-GYP domain-containing protein (c-di-GMP phosphodiesterase class II)
MTPLLSQEHRIIEKGRMDCRPFGEWAYGEKIRDVSGVVIRGNVEFLEEQVGASRGPEAGRQAVADLCRLLNERIADPAYHVTPAFLKNIWHSYSYEFAAYLGEFCILLSGDPDFQSAMASEKFLPPLIQALGRPFSVAQIYGMFPYFGDKFAKGSLHFEVVTAGAETAVLRMRLAEHVARQFGPYRKRCAWLICQASKAGLAVVPAQVHGLRRAGVTDRLCLAEGADCCEWELHWEEGRARRHVMPVFPATAGVFIGAVMFAYLHGRYPFLTTAEALTVALLAAASAGSAGLWWNARQQAADRDRLLREQLRVQEQKHEDLREVYLIQEQSVVELRRIAMEKAELYQELDRAFEGFVRASVKAIESRDPVTSGHSTRVASLTCGLAGAVDRLDSGPYASLTFSSDAMRELRYAALLHDFGKVGVREHILLKAEKLLPEQRATLCARFQTIKHALERTALRRKIALLAVPPSPSRTDRLARVDAQLQCRLAEADQILRFVLDCNRPTVLAEGNFERLRTIAARTYDIGNGPEPYLTADEVEALAVRQGSLTAADRRMIESHVTATYEFLCAIPWSRSLNNVPVIAYGHHEKLDGAGYPRGLSGAEIGIPTRMMTIADIYDALTAADRPYKKSLPATRALDLLQAEARAGKVDAGLLEVFVEAKIYSRSVNRKASLINRVENHQPPDYELRLTTDD